MFVCLFVCIYNNTGNDHKIIIIIVIIIIINHHYELFYIVIIVVIIIGKSYSHQEKGVKNYVRVDNKYFNPLKQHSI